MEFKPGKTVGIDLGTSTSAMAYLDENGAPKLTTSSEGKVITPSVITLLSGASARVGLINNRPDPGQQVVTAIKRQMGNSAFSIPFAGNELSPEVLSALILKKLIKDGEAEIGPIGNAVISVPYYFNDACRRATVEAGRMAGLNIIDIVNEPTAATLAFAWATGDLGSSTSFKAEKTILVYDLGGGTFDVTVVKYSPLNFRVIATDGDTFLGGLDWTRRVVDYVSDEILTRTGFDPRTDPIIDLMLQQQCQVAKHALTKDEKTNVRVDLDSGTESVVVSRRKFLSLTADLLQRTRDTTELVLDECRLKPTDLDEVVLVGGSTWMPEVRKMLQDLTGRVPVARLDPQRAVAQGAAIHASILLAGAKGADSGLPEAVVSRLTTIKAEDVNAHSLGVVISDPANPARNLNHIMIPRNSRLPAVKKQRFVTNMANPQGIKIRLIEGEVPDVTACVFVGSCRISDLPANLPIGSPVEVTYAFDERRHIVVTAKELTGNREATVRIIWETGAQTNVQDFTTIANNYKVE